LVDLDDVYNFDVVIVGAGVVGLATAHELAKHYENILIVEKENSIGQHTSSRNSGIIHSGIYYPPRTLKSSLCLKGNTLLYDFLLKHDVPHNKCGKLIVASTFDEIEKLDAIYQNGIENKVQGLRFLTVDEIKKAEPNINAIKAIYVPTTGIVNAHQLMNQIRHNIIEDDVVVIYNNTVSAIKYNEKQYTLSFTEVDFHVQSKVVINAAGLWSDKIAQMIGINDYELEWYKGEYYKTNKYRGMNHLVYPLPDENSLGIHTVIDLEGNLSFGPNAYFVNKVDYDINFLNHQEFCDKINKYLSISHNDIWPDTSGIRPKIKQQSGFRDFVIANEADKGYKNFINLIGIESPGLTCCFSIAEYVKNIIEE
jgi:L-2-hydroxyglutarate oxidase LhgO